MNGLPAHDRHPSEQRYMLLDQILATYQSEGIAVPYTMEDFRKDYIKEHLRDLTGEDLRQALERLTPAERLEGLSPEEIERVLQARIGEGPAGRRKPRRKKQ